MARSLISHDDVHELVNFFVLCAQMCPPFLACSMARLYAGKSVVGCPNLTACGQVVPQAQ